MEWQAVVLALQILLLAAGWLLFQRARGELSVRAAETPILAEVRALQKNVKLLLSEIESTADRQALRLENGCSDAVAILDEIENKIRDAEHRLLDYEERLQAVGVVPDRDARRSRNSEYRTSEFAGEQIIVSDAGLKLAVPQGIGTIAANISSESGRGSDARSRRDKVFLLADSGLGTAAIAQATRLSEGEVETMLGLRTKV